MNFGARSRPTTEFYFFDSFGKYMLTGKITALIAQTTTIILLCVLFDDGVARRQLIRNFSSVSTAIGYNNRTCERVYKASVWGAPKKILKTDVDNNNLNNMH